jgi:hypothetical protein
LAIKEKVLQHFLRLIIINKRADRKANDEILSILSGLVFSFTVTSLLGAKLSWVGYIEKGSQLSVSLKDHVPAFSSITAVRTSPGDKLFSPKTDTAISTIARFHMDSCFIHKFHFLTGQMEDPQTT